MLKAPSEAFDNIITQLTQSVKELVGWFKQHPQTDALEAEKAFWQALNPVLASVMQECFELLGSGYLDRTLPCQCGARLEAHSLRPKTFLTSAGSIELQRYYYYCRHCKASLFPLDEQLGFSQVEGQGAFSPLVCCQLLALAAELPFEKAAQFESQLTQTPVRGEAVRQLSEGVGAKLEAQIQLECEAAFPVQPQIPPQVKVQPPSEALQPALLYGSFDGVMTPLRAVEGEGEEREVAHYEETKLACFYQTRPLTQGEERVVERQAQKEKLADWERERSRAIKQSYVAYLGGAEGVGQRAWLEGERRGASRAKTLIFLGDGARWIWHQVEEHWPEAVQILDWYHACEHLGKIGKLLYGENPKNEAERQNWYRGAQGQVWSGNYQKMLEEIKAGVGSKKLKGEEREQVEVELEYFSKNGEKGRLDYPRFREAGYHIGSGTIESGCKQVVKARLKGSGMHWKREGAQAIENVRSYVLSKRSEELEKLFKKAA